MRRNEHRPRRLPGGLLLLLLAGCGQVLGIEELSVASDAGPRGSGGSAPTGGPPIGGDVTQGSGGEADPDGSAGGSGGMAADGGVAGDGGRGGESPAPAGGTVIGTVIDYYGHRVPEVVVAIGDEVVVSDQDGEFTVPDVPAVYDVELTIETRYVGNNQAYGWVFEGLTRRDPTLQVYRGRPIQSQTLTSEIENVTFPLEDQILYVAFGGPDGGFGYDQDGTTLSYLSGSWAGGESTAGTTHGLLWDHIADDEGIPAGYVAYDSAPTALNISEETRVVLDLATDTLTVGSISGTLGNTDVATRELHVFARFDDGAVIPLVEDDSVNDFTYSVPALPDASLAVVGTAGINFFGDAETRVLLDNVVPGATDLSLEFSRPARLIGPAAGIEGAAPDQALTWSRASPVSVVQIDSVDFYRALFIVTTAETTRLRTLKGSGFQVTPGQLYRWTVQHHGDYADLDAATGPDGFLSAVADEEPAGPRRGPAFFTQSAPRGLTVGRSAE